MATAGLTDTVALAKAADESRGLAIDSISKAASGHMGLPLGCAEIGAVLFGQELSYAPPACSFHLHKKHNRGSLWSSFFFCVQPLFSRHGEATFKRRTELPFSRPTV